MARPVLQELDMNSNKIINLLDPVNAQDAATKAYVDAVKQALDIKDSVRVTTTAAGTLASDFENGDTVDGVTLATGDRILIKDQATGSENGIYTVNATGAPTRAIDADVDADVTSGLFTFVEEGTTNGGGGFVLTTSGTITVGTTALTFTQFSQAGLATYNFAGDTGSETITSGDTLTVAGGVGITTAAGATDTVTVTLDINSLTSELTVDGTNDFIPFYDASAGAIRKVNPDALYNSSFSINTAGNTGTGSILDGETLTINGGDLLTVTLAGDTFTIDWDSGALNA